MSIWNDQNVIVTGASSGIGQAIATQLIEQGAHVVAMARRAERLQAISGAMSCPVDLADAAAVPDAVSRTLHDLTATPHGQTVDAIFYIAGVATAAPPEKLADKEYERLMGVNVRGARSLSTAVQPALAKDARIALCSSGITLLPEIYSFEFYRLSKEYLETFAAGLRQQLQPEQSVTVLRPGFVDTEIWEQKYGVRGEKLFGRLGKTMGFSAERCARNCLRDTANRLEVSYPTPDVEIGHELMENKLFGEVAARAASAFWRTVHGKTK